MYSKNKEFSNVYAKFFSNKKHIIKNNYVLLLFNINLAFLSFLAILMPQLQLQLKI